MSESDQRLCLYGIKACDTMKKARTWLDEHGLDYDFHDYKSVGIDRTHLEAWCNEHGGRPFSTVQAPPSASWTTLQRPILTRPGPSS